MAACTGGPKPAPQPAAKSDDRIAIVAAESGTTSVKLVAIDEHGDRRFDLLTEPAKPAREMNPAISPDGSRMVFASTRDRDDGETSLWLAKLGVEVAPTRLTTTPGVDSHPVWTSNDTIVYASTRDGDYDLWKLKLGDAPTRLTHGDSHEVTPTIARDGRIIYAAVDKHTGASHLEELELDGTIKKLTPGPDEREPALSPDGKILVFTSHVRRDGDPTRNDAELWRMTPGEGEAQQLVDLPPTDEGGAVWSRDGRYIFATSVLPGAGDRPVFASVVFIDREESPPHVRLLRDSAGAIVRVTPAIATTALDATALRNDPEYLPELARIVAWVIAKQQQQH